MMPQSIIGKRFKKLIASSLVVSLLLNPIAYATSSYIELDSQESEATDRLHTMMPLSKVSDVSHLEIDLGEERVSVHKHNGTTDHDLDAETLSVTPRTSVLRLPQENVRNLPWHLGEQGLKCFLSQHTAWLTPLSKDDYKIEFTGRLLGGGSDYGGDDGGRLINTIPLLSRTKSPQPEQSVTKVKKNSFLAKIC